MRHLRLRRVLAAGLAALATVAAAGCSGSSADASDEEGKSYKVGVFVVAQAELMDQISTAFEKAVTAGVGDAKVTFDVKNANGDQALISSIARDFASSDDDAFAVLGTPAVIALAEQVKDRPVFAIAMGDPVGAGVAKSLEAPGGNVTGSIDYIDPAQLLAPMQKIQPGLGTIGTVYDPSNQNLQVWVPALKKAAAAAGVKVVEATISGPADVPQSARSLAGRVDTILVGPDATVIAGMDAVAAVATSAKVPLYVVGGDSTQAGVFASIGPDYPELGTSAGANAAKILLGTATPATTPFTTPQGLDLAVNAATQKSLGLTVPAELGASIK